MLGSNLVAGVGVVSRASRVLVSGRVAASYEDMLARSQPNSGGGCRFSRYSLWRVATSCNDMPAIYVGPIQVSFLEVLALACNSIEPNNWRWAI